MATYKISAVRYADENYEKEIDKILIHSAMTYAEAVDELEELMEEANFTHVGFVMRYLRNKLNGNDLRSHMSLVPNLCGNLGPGGFILEKESGT